MEQGTTQYLEKRQTAWERHRSAIWKGIRRSGNGQGVKAEVGSEPGYRFRHINRGNAA